MQWLIYSPWAVHPTPASLRASTSQADPLGPLGAAGRGLPTEETCIWGPQHPEIMGH